MKARRQATGPSLQEVLKWHDEFLPPKALLEILGDGYLYSNNVLFRNVRDLAFFAGFAYTATPPFHYAQLPLLCLDAIWQHRTVPYVPNVPALRAVERHAPGRMGFGEISQLGLKRTPTFHEGVHCIARTLVRSTPCEEDVTTGHKTPILAYLFEESCANACEVVCRALAETNEHQLFVGINCYHYDTRGVANALQRAGLGTTLRVLIIAYLHANFLFERMSAARIRGEVANVLDAAEVTALTDKALLALFRRALSLSPEFRVRTTSVSLKFCGFGDDIFGLLDFEFSALLAPGGPLNRVMMAFVQLMELGLASPCAGDLLRARGGAMANSQPFLVGRVPRIAGDHAD